MTNRFRPRWSYSYDPGFECYATEHYRELLRKDVQRDLKKKGWVFTAKNGLVEMVPEVYLDGLWANCFLKVDQNRKMFAYTVNVKYNNIGKAMAGRIHIEGPLAREQCPVKYFPGKGFRHVLPKEWKLDEGLDQD